MVTIRDARLGQPGRCVTNTGLFVCTTVLSTLISFAISSTARAQDEIVRGEQLYLERCGGCHSIDANGAGPKHRGLIGRRAGGAPDFNYSTALVTSGLIWSASLLERWIADPNALVPGNRMVVKLANEPADRQAIVAYLVAATKSASN